MRFIVIGVLSFALGACSTTKTAVSLDPLMWNDLFYAHKTNNDVLPGKDIFQLGPELIAQLGHKDIQALSVQERSDYFLNLVYGSDKAPFLYEGYHSTVASKTWDNKRGDCISLTILAYAIGKSLNLPILMQEVGVPVQFDRRGNVEYMNGHVNALISDDSLKLNPFSPDKGAILIDFDPVSLNFRRGKILEENQVLARFYNNLGAEYLSTKEQQLAYRYFKAAILTDPSFSASFSNLAQLYLQNKQFAQAEHILKQSLQLNPKDAVTLHTLVKLLKQQDKQQEAQSYAAAIEESNAQNPYFWIGSGLSAMSNKNYQQAIHAFERAQALSHGFAEVHQNLAEAYLKTGEIEKAKEQIKRFANLLPEHPKARLFSQHYAIKEASAPL